MKKQMKSLIIGLVCVLALVGVLVALMVMPEKEEPASSSTVSAAPSTTVELLALSMDDVARIDVKNTESYSFEADPKAENEWIIKELEGLPKVKNAYAMMVLNACSIKAQDTIEENAADLAAYGLAKPVSTVTVTLKDGTKHTVEIGNEAPGGSAYTYLKMGGDNTVYVVNTSDVKRFLQVKSDYINTELFTLASTEAVPTIMKMEISGAAHENVIKIEPAESMVDETTTSTSDSRIGFSTHVITEPKLRDISITAFTDFVESLFYTTVESIEAYNVTDADLAQYGLDNPYVCVRASYQETVTDAATGAASTKNGYINFRASEMAADGTFYLMYDEVPVVYKAYINDPESKLTYDWLNAKYKDIVSRLFILPVINGLDTVTVEIPDGEYVFDLTLVGEGTDDQKLNVHYNGKALDEKVFKKFYQVLIGATAEDVIVEEVSVGEPLATFTYKYVDKTHADDVISFYEGPARQVYVSINGDVEFTTRSIYIDKVYDSVAKVIENIEVNPNW